jgi:GAF domain-containing protein
LGANAESSAEALDRIARTACRVLGVPVVLVNLVSADRQHFVGCAGPEPWPSTSGMPITAGFCPFTLGADESYSLSDARVDPVLAANAAVEQFGVVAYAGVPLRSVGGEPIGTLCAVDYEPRVWSEDDLGLLADLAAGVVAELQLLTATRLLARDQVRLRALATLTSALVPTETADDVIDEVVRAVDRFHPNAVWLLMPDESGQALRTAAATGAARHGDVPLTAPMAPAEVVRTGEPDFAMTRADVRDRFDALLEVMPEVGAVAVLPLSAGEHHVGALAMSFADERPFSADDRAYLAAVGGVSGLALARGQR